MNIGGKMKFGYARVSTKSQNLEMQIKALKKYGVDEIYEEKVSTRSKKRSELKKLINKLRTGDTLVVYKLDRLGRTVKQLLQLAEEFKEEGINFVSIKENFDTSTATGRFVFNMLCALAQMERDLISERTIEGLKNAKEKGRVGGQTKIDEEKIDMALQMYYSNDYSIKEILNATDIGKSTLYKYINKRKEQRD